ncbi:iron-containing redox enzyme family protein [Peredibacter starrii]|uniref:Iron-containing redox enzyme family protein n=1 Tax=Peredibacter starrii TaxID=28202 RepID=A0AAX4HVM6_9BACT|nr:iron-containing redox enzyme family protein [Peredibacter starrii]WPU67035.1 iron-containing redox enzyme family protein [Peredibacter starrii]
MNIKKAYQDSMKKFSKNNPSTLFKDKEVYGEWLAQTYFFVRHSTSLLGYSLPHLKNEELRHHFEHHLGEEERHDLLALKDIERLGKNISQYQEMIPTQAFYHSQYYRISFEGGTSLLGYILFLEGLAVNWAKDSYMEIKDLHKGSVLFLKVHAEEDPHHLEEAIKTISSLSQNEQECILRNLHYSEELYQQMMHCILEQHKKVKAA